VALPRPRAPADWAAADWARGRRRRGQPATAPTRGPCRCVRVFVDIGVRGCLLILVCEGVRGCVREWIVCGWASMW
jgi:hypothetical protein